MPLTFPAWIFVICFINTFCCAFWQRHLAKTDVGEGNDQLIKIRRIVAIGDLHGDFRAFVSALRIAKLIDDDLNWNARNTMLVQTGDVMDRGPHGRKIYKHLLLLAKRAKATNSIVKTLLGNHEILNILKYSKEHDYQTDDRDVDVGHDPEYTSHLMENLMKMDIVHVTMGTVFVHAGIHLELAESYTPEKLNEVSRHAFHSKNDRHARQFFFNRFSPVIYRGYASAEEGLICPILQQTLDLWNVCTLSIALVMFSATRMVVGHTIQENGKINARCINEKTHEPMLYMIDTGMSKFLQIQHNTSDSPIAVLEIINSVDGRQIIRGVYENEINTFL